MIDYPASTIDLQAFAATVEAGGFAAAGQKLGMTRSAVAKAVGRLETRFGTRLLTRSTRRLALTEDGRRFHARCKAALEDLWAAEAEISQRTDTPHGVLRLSVPDAYGRLRLMPVAARFLALHPAMQIELNLTDRLSGIVAEGVDLAIRIGSPHDLPPDLMVRVIDRVHHGFYASPGYLADRGRPRTLDELAAHDGIAYATGDHRWRWRALSGDGVWQVLDARLRISVDSGAGVLQAAVAGLGIAFLPDFLAATAVAEGLLERVPIAGEAGELPVAAIYPSRRNLPAKVRAFLDML